MSEVKDTLDRINRMIGYIEQVCRAEKDRFAPAGLDGHLIGILGTLPGLRAACHNLVRQAQDEKAMVLFNCMICGMQHNTVEECNACEESH